MLRITWSGIALHGGPLPGYAASHGCVRMPYGFAEKLFDKVRIGMRVIIAPNDAEPVEFSHPALFAPNSETKSEAIAARAETLARAADEAVRTALAAKGAAAAAAREAAPLAASLRKLKALKTRADAAFATAEKALAAAMTDQTKTDQAKTDQAVARAEERKQKAAAGVAEVQTQLDTAEADAKSKLDAAAAAQDAAKAAEAKRADAAKAAREAKLALEPVSVFISRATQKLYVRRGFEATFEVPLTIRNPDQPIGTHVFTAVARAERGLRWTAVTIDSGDDVQAALDRISIPQDVLDRIAPTALPRSSLIISDEPPNRETNNRTEFVVALHNQPQGGLAMRRAPADVRVARGNFWDDAGFTRWRGGQYYYPRRQGWRW
jgi:chemotaxis protein histidine kinase CheA